MHQTLLTFCLSFLVLSNIVRAQCPSSAPISGPTQVCQGTNIVYLALPGAPNSSWSISGGGNIMLSSLGTMVVNWTTAGTYTVTYTYQGCATIVNTLSVTVTNSTAPSAPLITGPQLLCIGSSGAYSVPVVAGMTPQWSILNNSSNAPLLTPNGNAATVTANSTGSFTILASYSNGSCSGPQTPMAVNVSSGTTPISITSNSSSCSGGTSAYSITGGDFGNTYSWVLSPAAGGIITPSGTNNSLANIQWNSAGTFTLTANATNPCNASGLSTSYSITVAPPLGAIGSISSQNNPLCYKTAQTFSIASVTGAQTYTWSFTPSIGSSWTINTTSPSVSYTFNSGGQYTMNVTASNASCSLSSPPLSFNVIGFSQPPVLSYPVAACVNNAVTVNVTNSPDYTYSWGLGDGVINGSNNTSSISAQWPTSGPKVIQAIATSVCDQISVLSNIGSIPGKTQPSPINVQSPTLNLGSIIPPTNNSICLGTYYYGLTTDPSISNVSWSSIPASSSSSSSFSSISGIAAQVSWLTSGTNTLVATASNSCGSTAQTSIQVQVNSGTKPLTYYPNGGYNPDISCLGATKNYSIPYTAGYSYTWNLNDPTGGIVSSQSVVNSNETISIQWTKPGTNYVIGVQPSNGTCDGDKATVVAWIFPPTAIVSQTTPAQTVCLNGSISPFSVSAIGGGLSYQWYANTVPSASNGSPVNFVTGNTGREATYTPPSDSYGTRYYYVVVTGSCGTVTSNLSGAITVGSPTTILSQPFPSTQIACQNGTPLIDAVSTSGTALTYQWYNNSTSSNSGGVPVSGATTFNYSPSTATPGTFYYYVVVSGGCGVVTSTVSGQVTVNPPTSISSQTTTAQTICLNGTLSSMSVTAGGTAPFTYQWYSNMTSSNSGGTLIGGATASTFRPPSTTAGTKYYYVIVSGACGGTVTSSVSGAITITPPTSISVQPSSVVQSVCQNGTLNAISVTAGGTAPFTYQWYSNTTSSNSGGILISGATASTFTPPSTTAGIKYYYVVVSDACGSSVTSVVSGSITINQLPSATITPSGATTFCQGGSVTLTASSGPSYLWSTGATTQAITVSTSGNYSVTVTNSNNCSATSSATIVTVNPLPTSTITPSGATTFCQGGSVTLTASSGISYLWSTGATTQAITVSASGNYSITVTNSNNCSATSGATTVTVNPLPTATINPSGPTTFCQSGSVTLTASLGSSYLWSTGATSQSITVGASGNYPVTVTNSNGCSATSSSTTVTVNPGPVDPTISANVTSMCLGTSVVISSSGGTGTPYYWCSTDGGSSWNVFQQQYSGQTSFSFTPTQLGTYRFHVRTQNSCGFCWDVNNCPTFSYVDVTVYPLLPPTISTSGSTSLCSNESVTLTSSGATNYFWSTGATGQSTTVNASGSYTVTIVNSNGCYATSSPIIVTANTTPSGTISVYPSNNLYDYGYVQLTAPSGNSYSWSTGNTNRVITVYSTGTYSVTVYNGTCSKTFTSVVKNIAPPPPPPCDPCSPCYLARVAVGERVPCAAQQSMDGAVSEVETLTGYPNPSSDILTVATPWIAKEDTQVQLYDMFGKLLTNAALKKGEWKTDLSVSNCADGLYVVKVGNGDLINAVKVMVVHK